jgi:hypothetical protein
MRLFEIDGSQDSLVNKLLAIFSLVRSEAEKKGVDPKIKASTVASIMSRQGQPIDATAIQGILDDNPILNNLVASFDGEDVILSSDKGEEEASAELPTEPPEDNTVDNMAKNAMQNTLKGI